MTGSRFRWCVLSVAAIAVLSGCNHKTDVKTELETTAGLLQQTESAPAPAAPAEPAPTETGPATPAIPAGLPAEPTAAPALTPAQQMQHALASYKSGELEDAVTRLQKLRTAPTLTAQQRMAVQDSVAAVMNEIYDLASKGDQRAIQAVRQYEEMQTSRH